MMALHDAMVKLWFVNPSEWIAEADQVAKADLIMFCGRITECQLSKRNAPIQYVSSA